MKIYLSTILAIFFSVYGHSQYMKIEIQPEFDNCYTSKTILCEKQDCELEINNIIKCLQGLGFLESNFSKQLKNDTLFVSFNPGEPYLLNRLELAGFPTEEENQIFSSIPQNLKFNKHYLDSIFTLSVERLVKKGFPLVNISYKSVEFSGRSVNVIVEMALGNKRSLNAIYFSDNILKPKWLKTYLNIDEKRIFDTLYISETLQKLNRLGINLDDYSVSLDENYVNIKLEGRSGYDSGADGLLGMVNIPELDTYSLMGYINLNLFNSFGTAKKIDLNWRRLRPESQDLRLNYFHPSFFHPNIDFEGSFSLLKNDSLFLERNLKIGLNMSVSTETSFGIISEFINSGKLNYISQNEQITDPVDFSLNYLGLKYIFRKKNLHIDVEGYAGIKKIEESTKQKLNIPEISIPQFKLKFYSIYNYRMNSNWSVSPSFKSGLIYSNYIFMNDLFRIGGLNSMRGFRENQFFTSKYGSLGIDFKRILNDGFDILFFLDGSIIEEFNNLNRLEYPLGVGAGMNLALADNIRLKLIGAIGKTPRNEFSFQNTIIHVGFSSVF